MTITDPDKRQRDLSAEDLRTVYGLTRAEALVAADLAAGGTIIEVAEHRGIAVDTTRKHLKSVFEKTGTHRQAELVERLLRDAVLTPGK